MPSHNIAVQKTVYEALAREKRSGESFTSLLRRLLDQRGGLEDVIGAWGKRGSATNQRILRSFRVPGRRKL